MKRTTPLLLVIHGLGFASLASACNTGATVSQRERESPVVSTAQAQGPTTQVAILVDGSGYHPASVSAPAGQPARLVFTRTSDEGCGQQLVFPSLDIHKDLPLNQGVNVDITMPASGSIAFTCGMNMLRGSVVAQ